MAKLTRDEWASYLVRNLDCPPQEALAKADRLYDMQVRGITPQHALLYLKSGGWEQSLADVYRVVSEMEYKPEIKKKGNDVSKPEMTIEVAAQLVQEVLDEVVTASGFRSRYEKETRSQYKDALLKYLKARVSGTIPVETARELLDDQVTKVVEASGFRGKNDAEQTTEYIDALLSYLRALALDVGSRNPEDVEDTWLLEVKTKAKELAALLDRK